MSEAPPFWFEKAGPAAWALSPASLAWGHIAARRMRAGTGTKIDAPVFCVGNYIVGGAGKTPTALALGKLAQEMGLKVGFLSRGYGGSINGAVVVDLAQHNARDVGDEPLLLAQLATTAVSADRPTGATLLVEAGCDFIIMDDGLQNPGIHKDFSLAVIDSRRGIGNGFCIPAGPVRANLTSQIGASDAVLLIGKAKGAAGIVRRAARAAKPILEASVFIDNAGQFKDKRVLAFSGLADNTKFHLSLRQAGAVIVEARNFHDHHPFTTEECRELLARADAQDLALVTTEKDHIRLKDMGGAQELLRGQSKALTVHLRFENDRQIEGLIEKTVERARARRLSKAA